MAALLSASERKSDLEDGGSIRSSLSRRENKRAQSDLHGCSRPEQKTLAAINQIITWDISVC